MFGWTARLLAAMAITLVAPGSVKAQPQDRQMGGIGITVFDDIGYRGPNATFRNDQPDLGPAGFSNRISSLQVAPGEIWEVCQGVNYGPPCQVFSGNESDLRRRSWNDRISSLRRVRGGSGGGGFPNPGRVIFTGAGWSRRRAFQNAFFAAPAPAGAGEIGILNSEF